MDISAIKSLLDKLKSEDPEVRTRSVKNIHSKIKSQLVCPRELIISFRDIPG
jgi:hypothetical protein